MKFLFALDRPNYRLADEAFDAYYRLGIPGTMGVLHALPPFIRNVLQMPLREALNE